MDPITRISIAHSMRQDPPRFDIRTGAEEPRVRCSIESQSEGCAVAGHLVNAGKCEIEVYVSQLPEVESQVETWLLEPVIQVTKSVRVRSEFGDNDMPGPSVTETRHVLVEDDERKLEGEQREAAVTRNRAAVARGFAAARTQYGIATESGNQNAYRRPYLPSEPAAFREVFRRDMRPFTSLNVTPIKPARP